MTGSGHVAVVPDRDSEYTPVIGLEIHAQISTRSKMFCRCSAAYAGAAPNTHVCTVCGGMPGSLPVINAAAVESTLLTALALNCVLPEFSKFDRKNYPYPDLPKGYQITQYDRPIGQHGEMRFEVEGRLERCGITRVHLEEDTGKTIHALRDGREVSLVDYNRSGVPLMEIVSEPELCSPASAREYFAALRQVLMYLGVSDGNLQEGSLRADVNVSLCGPDGIWGTKVEIKNLNSFRSVERALEYEIDRQRIILAEGGTLVQETRGWLEDSEVTVSQRTKEYAHDYRYFPEPDLPPLRLEAAYVNALRSRLPEQARERRSRLVRDYGLSQATASVITDERVLADFFETAVATAPSVSPVRVANWITVEVLRLLKDQAISLSDSALTPAGFAHLVQMVEGEELSSIAGKAVLDRMFTSGGDPGTVAADLDLLQISDNSELVSLVEDVLRDNPKMVDTYRGGKQNALQALVGQVMKTSHGKANPQRAKELLLERIRASEEAE